MRAHSVLTTFSATALLLVACGGDDGDDEAVATTTPTTEATTATTAPSTTTTEVEPLTVLVTNDDGVAAAGIDALVEALRADPTIEVVVVAPAENQSGSGDTTTEGAVASPATTASGYDAVAVAGEPADAANHGLDVVLADDPPDLVISGINEGQNLGPIVDVSGTVGAARVASRRGIPSLAVSQGLAPEGMEPQYDVAVEAILLWLEEHREQLEAGLVVSINVPTCPAGEVRGTLEVPTAVDTANGNPVQIADCTSTLTDPPDDIAAFNAGYITVSEPGLG
jgi:5'-nucleotidase